MPRADVTIKTRDGNCPASVFTPANGKGPWPAVIFYMDGLGIRPVMWEMGQRLADGGYLVLQPDLYYRFGSYPPKVASEVLGNPKSMEELMKWVNSLDRDRKVSDSGAFIEFLFIEARCQRNAIRCHRLLYGRQRQPDRGGCVSWSVRSGRVVSRRQFGNR
jgi:carboxymethylenebutenolidase